MHLEISINASITKIWEALTKPEIIKQYMFGTNVVSDWQVGSSIVWKGEWEGKPYEDKGKILKIEEERVLQYSYFSSFSGKPDIPENYHIITIELSGDEMQTTIRLSQDNNATAEASEHSKKNWKMVFDGLKKILEA